jgi:hypothetical protein
VQPAAGADCPASALQERVGQLPHLLGGSLSCHTQQSCAVPGSPPSPCAPPSAHLCSSRAADCAALKRCTHVPLPALCLPPGAIAGGRHCLVLWRHTRHSWRSTDHPAELSEEHCHHRRWQHVGALPGPVQAFAKQCDTHLPTEAGLADLRHCAIPADCSYIVNDGSCSVALYNATAQTLRVGDGWVIKKSTHHAARRHQSH